jgi:acetyl esterase/lipase
MRIAACLALIGELAPAVRADVHVAPEHLRNSAPGTVFRIWPLQGGVPSGAKGYRILYRSTDANDQPVAVTGAVIFPAQQPKGTRRDVVAWAHPTTGVVSRCAPTLLPDLATTIQGIDELTSKGYVVVATDYIGLGTKDHHPYLIGASAARNILDSVRAARQIKHTGASHRFAVWGHSQGGHAALFTGQHAGSYAPELELVSVAAAAPATNLEELFKEDRNTSSGRSLTSMTVLSWSRIFGIPLDDLVHDHAKHHFEELAHDCIETLADFFKLDRDEQALERKFLKMDPLEHPRLRTIMEENAPDALPQHVPVFIAQGTEDTLVRPHITKEYVTKICSQGNRVMLHVISGGSHMFAGRDSAYHAVEWMAERFRGAPAPNDC